MLCRLPEDVAGILVETDDAGVVGAANVEEHGVSVDERRADHPMPFFGHGEFVTGVDVPELCAGVQVEAMERALGPKCVDLSIGDSGSGARSIVEMDAVAESARISKAPEWLARFGVEALDDLFLLE